MIYLLENSNKINIYGISVTIIKPIKEDGHRQANVMPLLTFSKLREMCHFFLCGSKYKSWSVSFYFIYFNNEDSTDIM